MRDTFHPWLGELALRWRRQTDVPRPASLVVVATLVCGALAVGVFGGGRAWLAAFAGDALLVLSAWPVPLMTMVAVLACLTSRSRLRALSAYLRHGWWAAAPLVPEQTTRTVFAVATLGLLATVIGAAALLLALAALAGGDAPPMAPLPPIVGGLLIGVVGGTTAALRRRTAPQPGDHRDGIRRPLLALRWLDDRRLPHLGDWQRRAALLRWRSGGNFWWIGVAALLIPHGTPPVPVLGGLLLVTLMVWLSVVQRASAASALAAYRALRATPLAPRRWRMAAMRYPVVAMIGVLAGGTVAMLVLGLAWRAIAAWTLLVIVLSLPVPIAWLRCRRGAPR